MGKKNNTQIVLITSKLLIIILTCNAITSAQNTHQKALLLLVADTSMVKSDAKPAMCTFYIRDYTVHAATQNYEPNLVTESTKQN